MGIGAIASLPPPLVCASFLLSLVTLNHTKRGEERTCPTLFVRGRIVSQSALSSKGNMTRPPLARVSLDGHHVCAHYALARDTQARHGWAPYPRARVCITIPERLQKFWLSYYLRIELRVKTLHHLPAAPVTVFRCVVIERISAAEVNTISLSGSPDILSEAVVALPPQRDPDTTDQ